MAGFFLDHNISSRLAKPFRGRGHTVISAWGAHLDRAGDREILLTVASLGLPLVTSDDDSITLHNVTPVTHALTITMFAVSFFYTSDANYGVPSGWKVEYVTTDAFRLTTPGDSELAKPTPSPGLSIPSTEELARRRAAVDEALARRAQTPSIAPLTTTDLVHMARAEEGLSYDPGA
ncbi:MAG: DUF5615 family PIN-like protein [Dehalococcoidia bacterium]